jgi:archaemetzincin
MPTRSMHQPIRRRLMMQVAAAGLLSSTSCAAAPATPRGGENDFLERTRRILKMLAPLHEHKKPNQPGDWLAQHVESGQTFEQYVRNQETPIATTYKKLYVQPLGAFTAPQEEVLKQTADILAAFFGMKLELLKGIALDEMPESAKRINEHTKQPQWLTGYLMNSILKPRVPKDAAAVLGLTAVDLWPGAGWNFVFGQASLSERVGVWSMARNGDPAGDESERKLFLKRTLKTAAHETGHMLGILHCKLYECGMNGSNNRSESDRQPLEFCPECQAKVYWSCEASPKTRLADLLELAKKFGLVEEARVFEKELAALKKI